MSEFLRSCRDDSVRRGDHPIPCCPSGVDDALHWLPVADKVVVYMDHNILPCMQAKLVAARMYNKPVVFRHLALGWENYDP